MLKRFLSISEGEDFHIDPTEVAMVTEHPSKKGKSVVTLRCGRSEICREDADSVQSQINQALDEKMRLWFCYFGYWDDPENRRGWHAIDRCVLASSKDDLTDKLSEVCDYLYHTHVLAESEQEGQVHPADLDVQIEAEAVAFERYCHGLRERGAYLAAQAEDCELPAESNEETRTLSVVGAQEAE